jgi:nitrite reductase (NADH) large subunit
LKDYIIVGNGVAGISAASKIRDIDKRGNIWIFSSEPYPFYTRIRLPEFISGNIGQNALILRGENWYREMDIELHLSEPIEIIDPKEGIVTSKIGKKYHYDELLIATGAHSFIPPIKGSEKIGVFSLRTIEDARNILDFLSIARKALLLGGGLLGLEAGNSLRKRGLEVMVVEFFPRLLPRQMDERGSSILQTIFEEKGFRFFLGSKVREIMGRDRVEAILLDDGMTLECDMVIISAGVRPNIELAERLGLKISKGIVVDDRLQTSIPHIFAAGDCIEHNGVYYGIWPASERQGEIAGINMAGGDEKYRGTIISNRLKVAGIDLISAGEIDPEGKFRSHVEEDTKRHIYRKVVFKNGIKIGCILLGDIRGYREILKEIEKGKISTNNHS